MSTTRRRAISAVLAIVALAMTWVVATSAFAANKPTYPTPYPWSKVLGGTTGDYFADNYNGVSAGHVFESASADRLLDLLSSNGTYYIALTGPEHASGQKALGLINAQAKAAGITKIYTWDPILDGYQLNSVDASGWGTLQGGTSAQGGTANVNEPWRLITSLLPSTTVQPGGALYGYDGRGTVLLSVKITDRTDAQTGKQVLASWSLEDTDAAAFDPTSASSISTIQALFYPASNGYALAPNSVRSQYQFFKRVYNASATAVETKVATPTVDRIAAPVQIFSDTDFPNGDGFKLKATSLQEYFDLVNSPGEKVFLFASAGCHNTQAIIGSVALKAKLLGTPVVYVVDLSLSSNVKFATGSNIDTATTVSATGGLWVRNSAASSVVASVSPYPKNGFSYLYGAAVSYLDPGFATENTSKQNNSIQYYPNGSFTSSETVKNSWDTSLTPADTPNAKRLQVPFLIRFDKDAAQPVTQKWLHRDSSSTTTSTIYDEYMIDLANVRETPLSLAATPGTGPPYTPDGLTRVTFAREAVAALTPVLLWPTVADAHVSVASQVYTGAALTPALTVTSGGKTLVLGTDYTAAYANNVNVGLASVTITGKGSYIGTQTVNFAINPKASAISKIAVGKKKITVTWGKVVGTTKYVVNYRLKGSSSWKTASVAGSKNSLAISGLKKGKTYQVRVEDFVSVSGVSYYSAWSATKTSAKVK